VTSVPARSVQQDHRIGYIRPGYDADLVIWDDHPLKVGATPSQVFIDGRAVLETGNDSLNSNPDGYEYEGNQRAPVMRPSISKNQKEDICAQVQRPRSMVLFTGIRKVLIDTTEKLPQGATELVALIENGRIKCLDEKSSCIPPESSQNDMTHIALKNGHITPGIVAFGNKLGIQSIPSESSTGDGSPGKSGDSLNENSALHFAKYGVHLHDRAFARARIGGVTRAITAPQIGEGIIQGVSVGLRTNLNATILDGAVWKDNVALHLVIGQAAKGKTLAWRISPRFVESMADSTGYRW
jgi:imidazolonepropionase-like amidohydrolase